MTEVSDFPTKSLRRAAAWRLCTEFVRRHPENLLLEAHAGGGMYDELVVLSPEAESIIRCNMEGSIHIRPGGPEWPQYSWDEYLHSDPARFLKKIEAETRLAPPTRLPSSTKRVLVYRVLADLMARGILTPEPPELPNGYLDTSGWNCEPREHLFAHFPGITPRHRAAKPTDPYGHGEYRFWFLIDGDQPTVAFEVDDGLAWLPSSTEPFELERAYRSANRDFRRLLARFDMWRSGNGA